MDLGIRGKNAIICASSRGLGKACALSLAINGVNVVLNGRDEKVLNTTKNEILDAAPNVKVNAVALMFLLTRVEICLWKHVPLQIY